MIKNIIFDIGNVLVGFDWKSYIKGFGFSKEKELAITKALFLSPYWNELDRGAMPLEELERHFAEGAPQYADDIIRAFRSSENSVLSTDYAIPWLKELKQQGFRLYYLSNYSEFMKNKTSGPLSFLPLMDGGLFSYEVHLTKPEPEIYHALLKRYPEIVPEESVFFDDSAANIEAAANLDFNAIIFRNKAQAENALSHLLRVTM